MIKLIIIILFCIPFALLAQKKEIRFQYEILDIPNSNFYIEQVVDGRANQKCIGTIEQTNEKDSIDLKDGASSAIYYYLKFILPKDSSKIPITLYISDISINEDIAQSIDGKLSFIFYKKDSSQLTNIYETKTEVSILNSNGLKDFEICLRLGLGKCLANFINENKVITQNYQPATNQSIQNTKIKKGNSNNKETEKIKKEYLLTYSNKQGINATGFAISFYKYLNKDRNGWIIPIILSVDIIKIKPDYFKQFDFQSAKLSYYLPGICAFKKLDNYFWFNLGLQMPIGSEILTHYNGNKTSNFILGLAPMQGFYFIPKSTGITFGIGLYEKILISEVYKSDLGLKVEIGTKF